MRHRTSASHHGQLGNNLTTTSRCVAEVLREREGARESLTHRAAGYIRMGVQKGDNMNKNNDAKVAGEAFEELDPAKLEEALGALSLIPSNLLSVIRLRPIRTIEIDPGSIIAKQYDR